MIPGLIDSHVHFFQSGNPFTRPDVADYTSTVSYADEVARNKARLSATFKIWLAAGVTSVVDTGGPMWNFEVRQRARQSRAPRTRDPRRKAELCVDRQSVSPPFPGVPRPAIVVIVPSR